MKEFINGTTVQFDHMRRELDSCPATPRRYRGIKLRDDCTPNECSLDITMLSKDRYRVRFSPTVTCHSALPHEVSIFLQCGFEGSFDEVVRLLQKTLVPLAEVRFEKQPMRTSPQVSASLLTADEPYDGYHRPVIRNVPDNLNDVRTDTLPDADDLYEKVTARVVGHRPEIKEITSLVADHIRKTAPQRPLTIFITGKPGVGKTLTAESLFAALEEGGCKASAYIEVNMNTFQEEASVARFTGSNPGYVGYNDVTVFEPVNGKDVSVILFDEVEKAHPKVLEALLQIMDKGKLQLASSKNGKREISFKKSIILFNSNMPVNRSEIENLEGEQLEETLRGIMAQHFNHAFISRLKYCCWFRELSEEEKLETSAACIMDVAKEYGLRVISVDYAALKPLQEDISLFGARILKNRVERMFGKHFAMLAREGAYEILVALSENGIPDFTVLSKIGV